MLTCFLNTRFFKIKADVAVSYSLKNEHKVNRESRFMHFTLTASIWEQHK